VVGYSTAMSESNGWTYRHRLSVRFRDCDAMGHVNHAVYFTYLEQCRLIFWKEITGAASPHTRVIIARAECDYRAPAHFGDELEVRLRVGAIGRSSFRLDYEIVLAATGDRLAVGKTVMVAYDYAVKRSVLLPPETRTLLERLMAALRNCDETESVTKTRNHGQE
jgi:acyl-CoA thioester hydrolase